MGCYNIVVDFIKLSLNSGAPLNLSVLLNYYNAFGLFPIFVNNRGQMSTKISGLSQALLFIGSVGNLEWHLVEISKQVDTWTSPNPASLLEAVLTILWGITCFTYLQTVLYKRDKILQLFEKIKETNLLFQQYCQSDSVNCFILIGLLVMIWIFPAITIFGGMYTNLIAHTNSAEIGSNAPACVSEFIRHYDLTKLVLILQTLWTTFVQPCSVIAMYAIGTIPVIVSFYLWNISQGFSALILYYKKPQNPNVPIFNEIREILHAYDHLKEISNLQNEIFGKIIWANMASSVLFVAQTFTRIISASAQYYDFIQKITIFNVSLMTVLYLYLGVEAIKKVQTMKEWLVKESVLENLSTNRLTILLHELCTHAVGVKGGSYFTVTHHFLVNVVGSIVTYFIIIYQFGPKENITANGK